MVSLKIPQLSYGYGPFPDSAPLTIKCKNVTVLVGPNNSGKSQTLKDVEGWIMHGTKPKILSGVDVFWPVEENNLERLIMAYKTDTIPEGRGIQLEQDEICLTSPDFRGSGETAIFLKINPSRAKKDIRNNEFRYLRNSTFMQLHVMRLDGRTRFNLVNERQMGDLTQPPNNPLSKIFTDDGTFDKLDSIIFKEFGYHFYLDASANGRFRIRLNRTKFDKRRSLENSAISFMRSSPSISEMGDGIQCYVGLLISVMSLANKVILIDEPEAFLHPPKARTLGGHIFDLVKESDSSLIVATHSAEFLMGCLDKGNDMTMVRLTYDGKNGTVRELQPDEIKRLTSDPLLRSTDTISALFHEAAIIGEADRDRVFYAEINRRLRLKNKGIVDAVFLNTQGKHTIHRIFGPLRKFGIPAIGIYDLDIIREQKLKNEDSTLWRKILETAGMSDEKISFLEGERQNLESEFSKLDSAKGDPLKKIGISGLGPESKTRGEQLIKELQSFGIFIVPVGDVERWLNGIVGTAEKKIWLVEILEELELKDIQPSDDDVWKFVSEMSNWIGNPNRHGMKELSQASVI